MVLLILYLLLSNVCWWFYVKITIYDMISIMPQRDILVYILYDDIIRWYIIWWWDVMRIEWWLRSITGPYGRTCDRGCIWGDYDSLHRGDLGNVSSERVVGVSSWYITHGRHIRVNTSMGTVYDFFNFHDIKIYMYYAFKSICIIKRTLVVSDFALAWRCLEKVFDRPWVLKKR